MELEYFHSPNISEEQARPTPGFKGGAEPAPDADDGGYAELVHNVCTAEDIDRDKDNALAGWMEKADNLVRKYIHLVTEQSSSSDIAASLRNMAVVKMMSAEGRRVGVFYTCQHAGESDSMPHCRAPAFRLDHLQKMIGGTIKACGLDAMPPGAVYFIMNGGSFGNNDAFGKAFLDNNNNKAMAKNKDLVYLALEEESLQKRRLRKRGGLNLMQGVVIYTPLTMELIQGSSHTAERLHYTSTTPNSNIISGVSVEPYEDRWSGPGGAALSTSGRTSRRSPATARRYRSAGTRCPTSCGKNSFIPTSWMPVFF